MARSYPVVNPLVPLSLLEAVRDADRPEGFEEAEYVPELLNKRLGTTDTVYTQIRRYSEAVRRGHPVASDEVVALARLIARRPDARAIFAAAGVTAARAAYERLSGTMRALVRFLPGFASRPLARRQARKLLRKYFGVASRRAGQGVEIDVPRGAPLANPGGDVGRAFYDAALHELLYLLGLVPPERPASPGSPAARAERAGDAALADVAPPDDAAPLDRGTHDASQVAASIDARPGAHA
jgi:hypothetical protein